MNIAFFLIPKEEVIYLTPQSTMRQALERMEVHRYSAVPLIDKEGRYVGTVTEGDLLWKIKNTPGLSLESTQHIQLKDLDLRIKNTPVAIDAQMNQLISLAVEQNFVPVVDDQQVFIGIIRRKEIIEYCYNLIWKQNLAPS